MTRAREGRVKKDRPVPDLIDKIYQTCYFSAARSCCSNTDRHGGDVKDILDFISNNGFGIVICFILFGGSIGQVVHRISRQRHERKMKEIEGKNEIRLLEERRRIAEIEGDAVKLLVADTALAEDFDQRLRAALTEAKKKAAVQLRVEPMPVAAESEEAELEVAPRASRPRAARRRG